MKPLVDSVKFFNSVILAKYSIVGRPTPPNFGIKLFPTLNVVIIIPQLQVMPKICCFHPSIQLLAKINCFNNSDSIVNKDFFHQSNF